MQRMTRLIRPISAAALVTIAAGAVAYEFEQHLWRERLLILVAPTPDDQQLEAQHQSLERCRNGVDDRDLRVFRLYRSSGESPEGPLRADEVRDLRQRLGAAPDDRTLLLVGKDGGIKRRAALDTDLREVFAQIDGMPMRRQEMQSRPGGPDCAKTD